MGTEGRDIYPGSLYRLKHGSTFGCLNLDAINSQRDRIHLVN